MKKNENRKFTLLKLNLQDVWLPGKIKAPTTKPSGCGVGVRIGIATVGVGPSVNVGSTVGVEVGSVVGVRVVVGSNVGVGLSVGKTVGSGDIVGVTVGVGVSVGPAPIA